MFLAPIWLNAKLHGIDKIQRRVKLQLNKYTSLTVFSFVCYVCAFTITKVDVVVIPSIFRIFDIIISLRSSSELVLTLAIMS
jgi:hypothetical protein